MPAWIFKNTLALYGVFSFIKQPFPSDVFVFIRLVYDWVSFRGLCVFMFQLKAMDDAITKAEEQVEKFTEMAKETKVLLYDLTKIVVILLYYSYLYCCTVLTPVGVILKKNMWLPDGVRFLNQSELTCCFINQLEADCNFAPLRFPALGRGCTISRPCRWLHRFASSSDRLLRCFFFWNSKTWILYFW